MSAAAHVIGRMEPRPGRAFGGEDPIYIVPDIYVYRIGDDFHVVQNDDGLPRLRINGLYREVLANKDNPGPQGHQGLRPRTRCAPPCGSSSRSISASAPSTR